MPRINIQRMRHPSRLLMPQRRPVQYRANVTYVAPQLIQYLRQLGPQSAISCNGLPAIQVVASCISTGSMVRAVYIESPLLHSQRHNAHHKAPPPPHRRGVTVAIRNYH